MGTQTTKRGYIDGLQLSPNAATPAYKVDVAPGACASDDFLQDIDVPATLTADLTASGAGGLDTGSEAASTWYYVYVIGETSGANAPAALLSASATSPTLPSGYDVKRRVGSVRNDSSSDFIGFVQKGGGCTRRYYFDASFAAREVLGDGNATTFTDVDCSDLMPTVSSLGFFQFGFETGAGGQAGDVFRVKSADVTNALLRIKSGTVSAQKISVPAECPVSAAQKLAYRVTRSDNSANIMVTGYEEAL